MLTTNLDPQLAKEIYQLNQTDAGNAEAFASIFGNKLRYVHGIGWHIWKDQYWQPDDSKETMMLVKELSKHRQMAITRFESDQKRKLDMLKSALMLEQTRGAKSCLEFAQSLKPFSCSPTELDTDYKSLACQNGTLYPEHGFLSKSDPSDLITKCLTVSYSEKAEAPRWQQFLSEVFIDQYGKPDFELIDYIQGALGYCLTGYTNERSMFVCYGEGANGKSTFINTVDYVMGSYAATIAFANLTAKGGENTGHDLAGLRGVRFLTAIENNEQSYLDEAKIKRLTGGAEPISVRFLYGKYFRYIPTYKIWLACNHKPKIRGTDDAIWSRMKLIPFNAKFKATSTKTDKGLIDKLKSEAEGILAWMVEGCKKWANEGLQDCNTISNATSAYRRTEDYFMEFLTQNVVATPGAFTPSEDIWRRHNVWASMNGYPSISNTGSLGIAMSNKGYKGVQQRVNGKPRRGYRDITLV